MIGIQRRFREERLRSRMIRAKKEGRDCNLFRPSYEWNGDFRRYFSS